MSADIVSLLLTLIFFKARSAVSFAVFVFFFLFSRERLFFYCLVFRQSHCYEKCFLTALYIKIAVFSGPTDHRIDIINIQNSNGTTSCERSGFTEKD